MTEPEWVCIDQRTGAHEPRWHLQGPIAGACWSPWHGFHTGSGHTLPGAGEHCAAQCCAGHRWTCCHDCGRDGDRSGDECTEPCAYPHR